MNLKPKKGTTMTMTAMMIATAASLAFFAGAALTSLVLDRTYGRALDRLVKENGAYVEHEADRSEQLARIISDASERYAENARVLRIVRNIVDATATGRNAVNKTPKHMNQ